MGPEKVCTGGGEGGGGSGILAGSREHPEGCSGLNAREAASGLLVKGEGHFGRFTHADLLFCPLFLVRFPSEFPPKNSRI